MKSHASKTTVEQNRFNRSWLRTLPGPLLIMAGVTLASATLAATPLPPFGRSVDFEKGIPEISPETLKGKAVLLVFMQSWCPKCNQWSGGVLRAIEAAHGGNPGIILLAIKTDGGGVKGAESYLKAQGANPEYWFIGSDNQAEYYKKLTGANPLWMMAVVNAEGQIAEIFQAGATLTSGPEKGVFYAGSKEVLKKAGKLRTLLPTGQPYPAELARIARLAELGALGQAMKECAAAAGRTKNKEAAGSLKTALEEAVKTRLDELVKGVGDEKGDVGRRYESSKDLALLVADLGGQPVAAEAAKLLQRIGQLPEFRHERAAEDAYRPIAARIDKASARNKPALGKELKRMAEKHPGTLYGKRASQEAELLIEPPPPQK